MELKTIYKTGKVYKEKPYIEELLNVKDLKEYLRNHKPSDKPFKPTVFWNRAGNFISIFWKDDEAYDSPCEDHPKLEVYKSFATNEIVGIRVWDVLGLLNLEEVVE